MIQHQLLYTSTILDRAFEDELEGMQAERDWIIDKIRLISEYDKRATPLTQFRAGFLWVDKSLMYHTKFKGFPSESFATYYTVTENFITQVLRCMFILANSDLDKLVELKIFRKYFQDPFSVNTFREVMKNQTEFFDITGKITVEFAWKFSNNNKATFIKDTIQWIKPSVKNYLTDEMFCGDQGLTLVLSSDLFYAENGHRIVITGADRIFQDMHSFLYSAEKYFTMADNSDIESYDQRESETEDEGE